MPRRRTAATTLLAATLVLLGGCQDDRDAARADRERDAAAEAATPVQLPPDPGARADAAIQALMAERQINEVPAHRDAFVDLDGDGTDEVLAWLDDPNWCTPTGCTLLVFRREGAADVLAAEVVSVRAPIAVAEQTHGGWRDILVEVGGETAAPGVVALQHDGIGYPGDPTLMAALASDVVPQAEVVID